MLWKYFAYHAIRWNDTPNLAGGSQEATIERLLSRPVTWAAPHIRGNSGNGPHSWADVCLNDPSRKDRPTAD